jgi:quinol monooxygenase YgiN
MVLEIAEFRALPGKVDELRLGLLRSVEVMLQAQGCRSAQVCRCMEDPSQFICTIEWATLEDHTVAFYDSHYFPAVRRLLAGLFVEPPPMRHYELVQ